MPQMSFAQIGTIYNSISNELEGGVTQQNQQLLLQQVSTVQTQLQGLINNGTFNNFVDPNTGNPTIVHAQNIADQMSFLSQQISTFGQNNATPQPKFINDVVRDVQDIVAGDANLANLANKGNHVGFQQVSNLLTPPAPFPDTPVQTATLNQFVADSNSLSTAAVNAVTAANFDPNSAATQTLIGQIQTFTNNANTYVNDAAQAGVFQARFENEFASHGVQGTASADLIKGLQTGDANLVKGAASVLMANANDVTGNMLQSGQTFTAAPNGGIPANIQDVHAAGLVFNDAVTKLIGGVYAGNQQSIVNDLNATATGLQNAATAQGISGQALKDLQHVVSLLGQESSLVGGINTAAPTSVSQVNGQIGQLQAEILSTVNHDQKLANLAAGANGDTAGFAALPSPANPGLNNLVANAGAQGNNNLTAMVDAAMANLASPPAATAAAAAGANIPAAANPAPAGLSPASPAVADHAAIDMAHANLDTIHQQIIPHLHDHLV
jgi:hypothetical protein